jgi:proline iminopeptidase
MATPFYEVQGQGPQCLLIAPIGAAWFRATLPPGLFEILTIVYVEPSGTGRSPGDPTTATIDDAVADLESVRTDLDADGVFVFGHSSNGLIALSYAAAHPEGTTGVLTVGTPSSGSVDREMKGQYWRDHAEPERQRRFAELMAAADAEVEESEEQNRIYRRADALRRWYDIDFDPDAGVPPGNLNPTWVKRVLLDEASQRDWADTFERVQAPVLVLLGGADFVVPPPTWQQTHGLANATINILDRSGHQPFFDEPIAFVDRVAAWLQELGPS